MFNSIIAMAKAKKNQKNAPKTYPYEKLILGYCQKTITEDDITFEYPHFECFYTNGNFQSDNITKVIRLTGDNLTHRPISMVVNHEFHDYYTNTCIKENDTLYCMQLQPTSTLPRSSQTGLSLKQINDSINQFNAVNKSVAKQSFNLNNHTK